MAKNTICVSLSSIGYQDDYCITEQGLIIDTTNQEQLVPNKKGSYRLKTKDGKVVYKALKPIYREVFGKEYSLDQIVNLDGEVWKRIDDKGRYFISNYGRVKSYNKRQAKILKPYKNQKGYLRVDINLGKRKTYLVHKLVALAFIENDNPIEKDTVDHINLIKTDNRAVNLRWLSRVDNIKAYYNYLQKGSENTNAGS